LWLRAEGLEVLTMNVPTIAPLVQAKVLDAISQVYDPEIPVNIYELGLIYDVKVSHAGEVAIQMTLTAPGCPSAQELPEEVESRVRAVEGVTAVTVEVVWEPAWTPERMSEAAKLQLGMW
jgi:FeS assembly SUF system protein